MGLNPLCCGNGRVVGDHEQNVSSNFLPSSEGIAPYEALESARSLHPGPSELTWHALDYCYTRTSAKNANWFELDFRVESGFDNGVLVAKLFYGRELSLLSVRRHRELQRCG